MPDLKMQLPETKNNEWRDAQFRFDGAWKPDVDGALIGPNNYQTLQNLRYKDSGLEGVQGYTVLHDDNLAGDNVTLGDYPQIRAGHQLITSNQDQTSYILVHSQDTSTPAQGRIFVNRTVPTSEGEFNDDKNFWKDVDNIVGGGAGTHYPYFQDASAGLVGRFSDAPQGNVAYNNGEESMIFGGDEQRVAAAFTLDSSSVTAIKASPITPASLTPIDVTKRANNTLTTTAHTFQIDVAGAGTEKAIVVMTTRPIQGLKFTLTSDVNSDTTDTDTSVKVWTSSGWSSALTLLTDTTKSGNARFAQSGSITFAHTVDTAKPMHLEELYLYAYLIEPNASCDTFTVAQITADMAMQSMGDVWDGVYRQPIQFQVLDGSSGTSYDYTLQVNESSDVNAPIGADVTSQGAHASDKVYIMFEDQITGIRMTMLGDLVNEDDNTLTMKYWNGSAFAAVTILDQTALGGGSMSQSGLISWVPPSDEKATTKYGSFGYIYELDWTAGTGTLGLDNELGTTVEVLVDVCTGVPAQKEVQPFDWSILYGTRIMMGGYTQGDEGNRMDYCVANAPDAWNGFDSSDDGRQSLYFGGVEPIVGGAQIYNRFGASIFSMLLVLKKAKAFLMTGTAPEDFVIYPVSDVIGCIAPKTIATAEIGIDLGNGLTRNVALWLSHSGPMMFDGAILKRIDGVKSFFDILDANFVNFSYIDKAVGWVDPNWKEYNLLLPQDTSGKMDLWLVYDLMRRKWFTKSTGSSNTPQAAWQVGTPSTGERHIYGGIDSGEMVHLEEGTTWGDTTNAGIAQKVKTGDFFPTGNIWDETLLRKFKIFIKRLKGSSVTNTLQITYYTNTEEQAGTGVLWQDVEIGSGVHVSWENTDHVVWDSGISATINLAIGLQRVIKVNHDLNRLGWAHAFEFTLTTTDVNKGFQPMIWGTQYRIERKDNTASDVSTL
jgi:hypothetical protein